MTMSIFSIGPTLIEPSAHIGQRVAGVLCQIDFNETLMYEMLSFMLFAAALHADFSSLKIHP